MLLPGNEVLFIRRKIQLIKCAAIQYVWNEKSVSLILFLNTVYIFYQEIKLFFWVYYTLKVFLNEMFKKPFFSLKIASDSELKMPVFACFYA